MRCVILSALLWLTSCGASPPAARAPRPAPRLVVVLVYDQLGSWMLERYLPLLDEGGAIRRTMARGLHVERARYAFASTFTAPGHAAVVTGAPPFETGIAANRIWDRERRSVISVMDDGEHPILGREGAFASPARLRVETVGDVLERETGGRAVTISISMKDRSAILPGGHHPDLCLWFDRRAGGFTTSTYYAAELPEWAREWQEQHQWQSYLDPVWEPRDPARLERALGADSRTGEGAYGYGDSFPHDARGLEDPDAFLSLPRSVELELSLVEESIARLHAGEDGVPDLVTVSISATDYVGHAFGPESWEYADSLARADALAGALLERLEARVPELAVVITSDHGAAPLVERSIERGDPAGRVRSEDELPALQRYLSSSVGPFAEVDAWVQPYVYLGAAVRSGPERDRVVRAAIEWLERRPCVLAALDVREGERARAQDDPIRHAMGLGLVSDWPGDVLVLPREHCASTEELPEARGTSHGSPWSYDREVPALIAGPGVRRGSLADAPQSMVASTIARLLGVAPPERADPRALFE